MYITIGLMPVKMQIKELSDVYLCKISIYISDKIFVAFLRFLLKYYFSNISYVFYKQDIL